MATALARYVRVPNQVQVADLLLRARSAHVVQHARAAAVCALRGAGAEPDVGHLPACGRASPGTSAVPEVLCRPSSR